MRRVRGQRTTYSFKRLLLCIFSRTGRNFTRICEVLPNEYTPQWIAARIGPHGHGSLLGDDVWYAVYWDYSDLPSDTWKQTARSLWLAMLSERGVTPTTADEIKFDVFVTSLQDAPAWREQKKLEKAERWTLNGCDSGNGSAQQCSVVWSGLSSHVQQLEHWCTSCSTTAGTRAWPVAVLLNSAMEQDFPGAASAPGMQPATTKVS